MHDLFLSRSFLVLNKDTTYQRKWEKIPLGIKAQMLPNEEKKIVQINLKYLGTFLMLNSLYLGILYLTLTNILKLSII